MPSSRPLLRLQDVADNCGRILDYTAGMSLDGYRRDQRTRDAVERCLQRISEAAYKLGPSLDDRYPDVPWKDARGVGNILRHGYDSIDDAEVWESIEHDVPKLHRCALQEIARLQAEAAGEEE